jgi:uncharacterized protein (DUF1697 family)
MQRYAAFLRGVTPTNLAMTALKAALEEAGFTEVRTVLASGNAVFSTNTQKTEKLESTIERALHDALGKTFDTYVRSAKAIEQLLAADPFAEFRLSPDAKRVVTFLRKPLSPAEKAKIKLPIEQDGARVLGLGEREVFTAYVRSPRGPVFMSLIQKTFGKETTTRTWDTLKKVVR